MRKYEDTPQNCDKMLPIPSLKNVIFVSGVLPTIQDKSLLLFKTARKVPNNTLLY
jgi:hypothetical protein